MNLLATTTLLTQKEVAEILRVSPKTVARLTTGMKLSCVKIGHSIRYRPEDIYRYISNNTTSILTTTP